MTIVTAERDIEASLQRVYDQWTQFESFPRFLSGVVETTQLDDSHVHWKVNVGGVEREFDTEITEQIPNQVIAWRSIRGPVHAGSVRFTPRGTGTRVVLELEWEPEGFVEKAGAALGVDNLQVERDLRRFAEFIERRGTPTGGWRDAIDTP